MNFYIVCNDQMVAASCFPTTNMKWLIFLFVTATYSQVQQNGKELVLVQVVSRHGERTPIELYKNDPHKLSAFEPFGLGQITNLGRQSQYETGQFLRQRYDKLLGNVFSPKIVHAQSTEADRAFMSCALVLAGMWPPKNTSLHWNDQLNWSPITIHSQPWEEDTLLMVSVPCPKYDDALKEVYELPEIKSLLRKNRALFRELSNFTGESIKHPDDINTIYSTLLAEQTMKLKLPDWTKKYFPDKLIPLAAECFIIDVYTPVLKRLKGGPLLKQLISNWSDKASDDMDSERKLFLYSAHDSTVVNIMHTLGVWEKQVPAYGIMPIFELYRDIKTNEYGVEVFLRNSTTVPPYQLTIPGCTKHCPLSQLIKLTSDVVPDDWSEECNYGNEE